MKRIKNFLAKLVKKIKKLSSNCVLCKNRKSFWAIIIAGFILALGILLVRFVLIAAVVDGRPITRFALINELEKQGGSMVLDSLIDQSLVNEEAAKEKVTVSDSDVNTEITSLEDYLKQQNTTLDNYLATRGMSKNDLISQIKTQKIVEKILGSKITVTDAEIQTYFDQNKSSFATGAKLADVKDQIKSQLTQQKLSDEYNTWIQDLRTKAKILYFVKF